MPVLRAVVAETGAGAVYWTHYPEPAHLERDRLVADVLRPQGVEVRVFGGTTLFKPEQVAREAMRTEFFRGELAQVMLLAREEQLDLASIKGSYAGAMGFGDDCASTFILAGSSTRERPSSASRANCL